MPIKLKNLKNMATIIKTKYGESLHKMSFIFCFKKDENSYFIFQEIQGMPIQRVVYHESNNSVTFAASWSATTSPYGFIADANHEQIENWKDLLDRTRPYNSIINNRGGFDSDEWKSVDKANKTDFQKRSKNKVDSFVEFRVDKIQRANFNSWGFEIYSPTISMIGFISKKSFPYSVEILGQNNEDEDFDEDDEKDANGIPINKVSWQGGRFYVPKIQEISEISQITNEKLAYDYDLSSCWDINQDNKEENEKFDEEIANILLHDKEFDKVILDVGQKKVDLIFE